VLLPLAVLISDADSHRPPANPELLNVYCHTVAKWRLFMCAVEFSGEREVASFSASLLPMSTLWSAQAQGQADLHQSDLYAT